MSVTAAFRFVQGTTFDVDRAAIGIPSALVTCQWLGDGTPQEWTWTMVSSPTGSVVPLGVFGIGFNPNAYFTPDIPGGYLVELTVIDPITGQLVSMSLAFLVPELSGRIIPPFRASPQSLRTAAQVSDLQVQGWHPLMEEWLRFVELGGGGGGGGAGVIDNVLGNQVVGSPLLNPGYSLKVVVGAKPYKVIPMGLNYLLFLRIEARNVVVYHTTAAEVVATITLPNREKPVGVSFVSSFIWIASNAGSVYKFDAGTYELVESYALAGPVADTPVAMTQAGGFLFIIKDAGGSYDSILYRVNLTTGVKATHSIAAPYGLVTDSLDRVWTGSQQITGNVTVIDPATFAETAAPTAGFNNVRVVLSVGGKMLVFADGTGTCYRYNELTIPTSDGTITGFPAGASAYDVAYDAVNDEALFVFGLHNYAGRFLTNPAAAVTAGSAFVPLPVTSFDTRSVAYSSFDAGFIVLDAYRDRSFIVDYTGVTYGTYLEVGGLLSFA